MHNVMLTRKLDVETPYKKRLRMVILSCLAPILERPVCFNMRRSLFNDYAPLVQPCDIFNEQYRLTSLTEAVYVGLTRKRPT